MVMFQFSHLPNSLVVKPKSQVPMQVQKRKKEKKRKGTWGDSIILWATTTTTPQLLSMKETTDNKVPLVKKSYNDPPNLPSTKNFKVDIKRRDLGRSTMIQKNIINIPQGTNIKLPQFSWVSWTWKLMSGWLPVLLDSTNRLHGQGASWPRKWSFEGISA